MAFNIEEFRETLEINRSDMTNDRLATNDLIIDDFMVELGYNRKRDKTVKRLHEGPLDWEVVEATGSRIAIKVFAIGETLSQQELDEAMKFSAEKRFSIFIVTNGEAMTVCRFQKDIGEYAEICDISFIEDLNEKSEKVLKAISKEGWDVHSLDGLIVRPKITAAQVVGILKDSVDDISEIVISKAGDLEDSDKDICRNTVSEVISDIGNTDKTQNSGSASNEEVENLHIEISSLKRELSATNDKLIKAQENTGSGASDPEKDKKIEELEQQVKELTATMVDDEGEKDVKIEELEAEVHRLNRKLSSTSMFTTGDENIDNQIHKYREQINDLTIANANYEEQVEKLEEELKAAKDEIDNMSGIERKRAHELLMVIEDDPNMDRQYVCVINSELLQYDEIHTFVGRSLQKLYEIKRLEASQYIFNGDIFKLSQPAIRNDLIMNNKQYDVNFDNMYEDEVLNKLRVLFSHFSDVVFECRKIGTLRDKSAFRRPNNEDNVSNNEDLTVADEISMIDAANEEKESEETKHETTKVSLEKHDEDVITEEDTVESELNDTEANSVELDSEELDVEADNSIDETSELFDEINGDNEDDTAEDDGDIDFSSNLADASFEDSFDGEDGDLEVPEGAFDENEDNLNGSGNFIEGFDEDPSEDNWETTEEINDFGQVVNTGEMTENLLVAQLLQIDSLIWMEDININFKNIKYIGSNSVTFNINKDGDNVSNEQLLCKCVDAIMAIESYNGNSGIVAQLKQTDFSEVNNFLHLYTEEYKNYPRINGTKYVASDVKTIQSVCSILYDICNYMNISMEEIFVYMTADTDSQYVIENYGYPEESVQLRDYNKFELDEDSKVVAIIKGDMFNNIVVTKNSLQAHKDIIMDVVAVKTKYLTKLLNNQNDLNEAFIEMVIKALEINNLNLAAVGSVIGESYRVISDKDYEVGPEPIEISAGGNKYYLAKLENWQILHALIKMHTTLFGNTGIAVKLVVNAGAVNFYGQQFDSSEPSLSLAVRSFADYVAANVKRN